MRETFLNRRRALVFAGFVLAVALSPAKGFAVPQDAARKDGGAARKPAADAGGQAARKPWSVRMTKGVPHTFTVKAKDASLSEIAGELSRLLQVPFTLSPVMAKQKVTLDFGGLNMEAALRLLAPQSFVDYVAGGEGAGEPKPLAVYLQALNEPPPSTTSAVHGNSEVILVEGDTEEGTESEAQRKKEEEEQLRVTYANSQLSVRARKQPLAIVLYKIANEVGVPFEMRYDTSETVDVDFSNYPIDQAVRSLSPGVRFYYRMDLQTFQVQPLRLALLSPSSAQS